MNTSAKERRWSELDHLFQRASELEASHRDAFLDQACGSDLGLRNEVEALLACSGKTLGWLKRPVDRAARELALVGRRIGSYVLIRHLAEGGMGKVFLAERADEQYRQLVAIKLMHSELWQSEAMLQRFQAERQILANLNHPNIARLIDGGMTTEGSPYLVMEYVDGSPLDEYCRANGLSVEYKLRLFLRICAAVEHAHRNLIVHRDIKPANVLVDRNGTPKLVDFGIAKLLEDGRGASTKATAPLMTPEYASPEQLRGEPVTTATDVYGLGVLLYDLLSGTHPFAEKNCSPVELMRHICEVDPNAPSAISLNGPDKRQIRGDLDRIVLMAIRKEPERRYPSASALASDVSAYLNGYPLFARGGGWRYRAGKFLRRHKLIVASLTLFALSLAGFSTAMAVLTRRANRERIKAERAATFLADMFRAATPQEARGKTITARELLDRGAQRVENELTSDPEVRASLLYSIADAYSRLGLYDQAKDLAERSYLLRVKVGPRDPLTADSVFLFANATRLKGEYAKAEPLFRQALDIRRAKFGDNSILVADSLSYLGECLFLEGKDRDAESILRRSLAVFRRHGPNYGSRARDYLARLLERKGDYLEATQLLKEAVEIDSRTEGKDSPGYTMALHNLAGAHLRLGDLYSAEAMLNESLATERRVLGNGHPDLGYPLNLLGGIALEEGNPQKAEPLLRESLAIWSKLDSSNVLVVSAYNNWAKLLQAEGKFAEARRYFERALATAQQQAGATYNVARILYNFAMLEFDSGNYPAAEENAGRALSLERLVPGGDTAPDTALTMTVVAEARLSQGDAAGAEPILRKGLEILANKLPRRYPPVTAAEVRLGEALIADGKAIAAEPILREALTAAYAPPFPIPTWQVGEAESALGWCMAALGNIYEAQRLLQLSQEKLAADPRPIFRRTAAAHLKTVLQARHTRESF